MGTLAWIAGILGALCMIMGVVTALAVVPQLAQIASLTGMFWLALAGVLLLISIALAIATREQE